MITRKVFTVEIDIKHDADNEPNTQTLQKSLKNALSEIEGSCTITYRPPELIVFNPEFPSKSNKLDVHKLTE